MPRRIKKANITFISLVPKGANKIAPIFKDDGSVEVRTLSKLDDEKGELTAVVYAPELRDSQGDIADAEVVKDMAHEFIANGASIDIRHDGKAVSREKARVAESFIVHKSDNRFHGWKDYDGNPVDLTGSWATVIKIDDEGLRKKYRSGEWSGVSMGGTAVVEQEKESSFDLFLEKLSKALNPKPSTPPPATDETMDKETLKSITDSIEKGFSELAKSLKPETPPTPEPGKDKKKDEPEAPKFIGKMDDERALTLYARKLELFNLKKGIDWSDPKSILAYREQVAVLKEEWAEEDAEAGIDEETVEEDEKPARKARTVAKAKAASSGSMADYVALGEELAKDINKSHGLIAVKD